MVNEKLSEEAICMALRYGYKDLREIFIHFGSNGLLFMQFINIYLHNYGGCVGYVSDLGTIVPQECAKEFGTFIEKMRKSGDIVVTDAYFFLPHRNMILGYSAKPSDNDIALLQLLHGKGIYKCPFGIQEIGQFLSNIVSEINAPMPEYVLHTERIMKAKSSNQNIDLWMRLTSYYLRHSTCMIGVVSDKGVTAKIINVKEKYLYYFLKDNPCICVDCRNMIFYDRQQRILNGLTEKPSEDEIMKVKCNFRTRVNFMNSINLK